MNLCATTDCDRPGKFKGLCRRHYNRMLYIQRGGSVYAAELRRRLLDRRGGSTDGARVVFNDGSGPVFGVVPNERRCRGCRAWATHWWDGTVSRDCRRGRKWRGLPVCLPCAALWARFGRLGRLMEIQTNTRTAA